MATLPGHASSPHYEGRRVRAVVEEARSVIADALGCQPRRVIFASGATEAARLAVDALAHGAPPSRRRVLCSPVEHPAVGGPVDALRARGFEVERLALNRRGALDVERLAAQMDEDVAFAAITLVNHDTGVIYGNSRIADIVTGRGAALLSDAVLAPGRWQGFPMACRRGVSLVSGGKVGALPGSGAFILHGDVTAIPPVRNGIQEEGLRAGSYGLVALASLAAALPIMLNRPPQVRTTIANQFETIKEHLSTACRATLVGEHLTRAAGIGSFAIPGCLGESLMMHMDLAGVSISAGSRCVLGGTDASPTLLAMGYSARDAAQTVRISMGQALTENAIARVTSTLEQGVCQIRETAR